MANKKQTVYFIQPPHYGIGGLLGGAGGANVLGAAGNLVGGMVGGAIGGGLESGAGSAIDSLSNVASAIPGPWGAVAGAGLKIVGGLVNRAFGSKLNQEAIRNIENDNNKLSSFNSTAKSFDDLMSTMSSQPTSTAFTQSTVGKDGWFSHKARDKYRELKAAQDEATLHVEKSIANNTGNLVETQGQNSLANFAAFGGPLGFTLPKGTYFAPTYALGGPLQSNGSDWTNGITFINNGGSHEENPYEGVPMGTNEQGVPNLVEEGEVVWNNYVFSNRLQVPEEIIKKLKVKGKSLTFADVAKKAQEESQERPNDPISKRGLKAAMSRLQTAQELVRQQQVGQSNIGQKFEIGGPLDGENKPTTNKRIHKWGSSDGFDNFWQAQRKADNFMGLEMQQAIKQGKSPWKAVTPYDFEYVPTSTKITPTKTKEPPKKGGEEPEISPLEGLRFAPAVGAGLGVFSDLMGWTGKPDYSNANAVLEATKGVKDVKFAPIGDYMKYTPFDKLFYINQLNANTGATRRNILNTAGGNRGAAMAGLLAADYNSQNQLGQLARQAEEYNLGQRERVATFNRGTNMFNSEGDLKAQVANNDVASLKANAAFQAASLRDAVDARASAAKSANLTNFFQALGDIGWEAVNRDMVNNNKALLYNTMGKYKAKGGYLTIKRNRK